MTQAFRRDTLACYQLAVRAHREVRARPWPSGRHLLREEAIAATALAASHIAHAETRVGAARAERTRMAIRALGRAIAAVDLGLEGDAVILDPLRQCGASLERVLRPVRRDRGRCGPTHDDAVDSRATDGEIAR